MLPPAPERSPPAIAAPRLFRALLEDGWDGPREALLLSSEALFRMSDKDMPAKMRRHLGSETAVRVLLYIRDPLDHAVSNYQQLVKRGGMTLPEVTEVNRSMTNAELALQQAFNRRMPRGAEELVSDPLCHHLPGIAPKRPPVPPGVLAAFLSRMCETVKAQDLGWLIPEAEKMYRVPDCEAVAADFPLPRIIRATVSTWRSSR